jgi:hypothetical protein
MEEEIRLIKKVLKSESFELIFNWLEDRLPPNERQNLEKMFIKWLYFNPTAFTMFLEEYREYPNLLTFQNKHKEVKLK